MSDYNVKSLERKLSKLQKKLRRYERREKMKRVEEITNLNTHDLKVILFHVLLAAVQGALMQLKLENFGAFTPTVGLLIQVLGEALRRVVV